MTHTSLARAKQAAKPILIFLFRLSASLFFDRKYLTGRHFDNSLTGWRWVWRSIWTQKLFGFGRHVPWPVSPFIVISRPENLVFDADDLNNFQTFGCYFQNFDAKILIGKGCYIAPNVGIITSNHDPRNPREHLAGQDVFLGQNCWIGMNSVILPGVVLGPNTVVGAGSVVTKSFAEGNCVLGGSPARLIRPLESPTTEDELGAEVGRTRR